MVARNGYFSGLLRPFDFRDVEEDFAVRFVDSDGCPGDDELRYRRRAENDGLSLTEILHRTLEVEPGAALLRVVTS